MRDVRVRITKWIFVVAACEVSAVTTTAQVILGRVSNASPVKKLGAVEGAEGMMHGVDWKEKNNLPGQD